MKKYITSLMALLCFLSGTVGAASSSRAEVAIHLKCDVTIEKAEQLVALFDVQGPQAVNVCLEQLEAMKAKKYIRSYTVLTNSVTKIDPSTLHYQFEATVSVQPADSKECEILLDTFIKNKSNNKMMHKVILQELDAHGSMRSCEAKKWINDMKFSLFKSRFPYKPQAVDSNNPIYSSMITGTKLSAYLRDKFGCTVKIHEFKCEKAH